MLECKLLRPDDYATQPWKNGRGTTREIARDPREPFRWRLSWATVPASGPFSGYPGYDRTLVIWRGAGIQLSHQGKPERTLPLLHAHPFKGEWETQARLSTEVEDFNAFALRGKARVGVYPTVVGNGEELQFPIAAQHHFLFGVEGEIEILEPNRNDAFNLRPEETARISRTSEEEFLNLRARGRAPRSICLWVVVRLL